MYAAKLIAALMSLGMAGTATTAESDLKELDRQCEAAREARLKPLRDAQITRCKANKRNDPQFCERFYADLGNASRTPDGRIVPRLFDDLPECVRAWEARRLPR